jgi:hypothetical protein
VYAIISESVASPHALVTRGELTSADREMLLTHNAVDPRAFIAPGGFQSVDLAARGEQFRHSSYVGLIALLLALAARRPRFLLGAVPAAVLGLGPYLWWAGDWVHVGGSRLALPFHALMAFLPGSAATHAQRVAFPVIAVVASVAALGTHAVPWRVRRYVFALVTVDALANAPWPLARCPELDLTTHAELGAKDRRGILDLPSEVGATMATSRYLVYQTASTRPIPYRPDARAGTSSLLGIPSFWVLALPSVARPEHKRPLAAMVSQISSVSTADLPGKGIRWIVVHRELDRGEQGVPLIERQLVAWFGDPEVKGTHAVWDTTHAIAARGAILPADTTDAASGAE